MPGSQKEDPVQAILVWPRRLAPGPEADSRAVSHCSCLCWSWFSRSAVSGSLNPVDCSTPGRELHSLPLLCSPRGESLSPLCVRKEGFSILTYCQQHWVPTAMQSFLYSRRVGDPSRCLVQTSHRNGVSGCGTQAQGPWAPVAVVWGLWCCVCGLWCCGVWALVVVVCGPSHWGIWALPPCDVWDLLGPGIELVSFALQDGFLTTGPSGSEAARLCPTLCEPWTVAPGSSVHGTLQARILEWVAISFSRGSSQPGMEPRSPALWADALLSETPGKPLEHQGSPERMIHYKKTALLNPALHK